MENELVSIRIKFLLNVNLSSLRLLKPSVLHQQMIRGGWAAFLWSHMMMSTKTKLRLEKREKKKSSGNLSDFHQSHARIMKTALMASDSERLHGDETVRCHILIRVPFRPHTAWC